MVLPGVGAMPKAMEHVRRLRLDELLRERVDEGVPVIGVCMGMQLLFDSTTELGGAEGIGLIPGAVVELDAAGPEGAADRLEPGRVAARLAAQRGPARPLRLLPRELVRAAPRATRGRARHGRLRQRVRERGGARPPLYGVQFHPEKSGPDGLRLLGNFVRSCVPVAA